MPLDYTNPHILKFLTENFEKAEEKRMLWFLKNQEKLMKSASFPENYKGLHTTEVMKVPIVLCMPFIASHHESSVENRRKRALRDGVIQGVSQLKTPSRRKGQEPRKILEFISDILVPEPIMKPVDPDVQNILYKPIPNGGRQHYLNKRSRVLPEDKYNFCETSTGVYGWRIKDSELSRQPTAYGRYFTFKHDVNSRSGPQPDPAYYQNPSNYPYSKCVG